MWVVGNRKETELDWEAQDEHENVVGAESQTHGTETRMEVDAAETLETLGQESKGARVNEMRQH